MYSIRAQLHTNCLKSWNGNYKIKNKKRPHDFIMYALNYLGKIVDLDPTNGDRPLDIPWHQSYHNTAIVVSSQVLQQVRNPKMQAGFNLLLEVWQMHQAPCKLGLVGWGQQVLVIVHMHVELESLIRQKLNPFNHQHLLFLLLVLLAPRPPRPRHDHTHHRVQSYWQLTTLNQNYLLNKYSA
ncbi:hypothetical protein C1H46_030891 [Malus baccata]|uniref:Uncharacterized protein n=1 Tax=Malus baccata TaxID=106549 RepID=A0A540LAS7_MALBA|nr:hypothetical protein C1H46_030891 [Malus baccata]